MNARDGIIEDFVLAIKRHELWLTLGWRDVLTRYRLSWLGPFWITVSMGIIAGVMGTLYSVIMRQPTETYIPYLTAGFIAWSLLSALITEGTQTFVSNAASIKEIPVPLVMYVFRMLWRNIIVFAHNIPIYVALILIFPIHLSTSSFLFAPALALVLLNGLWVGILLGMLNARYRDVAQLVQNFMRLAFFVTPVIWFSDAATGIRGIFVHFNPLYYFIEILRAPLLGMAPAAIVWLIALTITCVGLCISGFAYARWRHSIPFYL